MKVFLACMVLMSAVPLARAQDEADVDWYTRLFLPQNQKTLEREISQANSRRLKARQTGNKVEETKALIALGVFHFTRVNDYEQAMGWLIQSLKIEDSLDLRPEKIFTYLAMARVFDEVGNTFKSLELLTQAQKLNEKKNNPTLQTMLLNETGRVKQARGSMDDALDDYQLALEYARQLKQPAREAEALVHIGQLQTKKKKNKEALAAYKSALAIYRSLKDKSNEAASLNEVGEMYRLMKSYDRALANHTAALEIRDALNDDAGRAQTYNNIGALYLDEKNFKRAQANLALGLQAGKEAQDQNEMLRSYDFLSLCFKEMKDFRKALEYREQFLALEDFIQRDKSERRVLEAQNRYVMDKQELAINQLAADREQRDKVIEAQDKLRNILFLLIAFGLIIVLLVLFLYILKQRSNRKLQELNGTKDKLFSIIGHDLKGPLNSLSSFSFLLVHHIDSISKEEIKMLSQDLDKSLKNLFALLENLLEWSRAQTGNIDFKPEAFDLAVVLRENEDLLKGQAQLKQLALVNDNPGPLPVTLHRHSINTVVRNLLSNAIKFTAPGGSITLAVLKKGNQYEVSVTDTGVGMSAAAKEKLFLIGTKHSTLGTAKEKGTGLGLVLCKEFVEQNGGTIGVDSEEGKGSRFYFTIPAKP